MAAPKVFFVVLRQPDSNDLRPDPFYEFGSFGCTKCHSKNLLHLRKARALNGSKLAFVQGGHGGFRLVLLSSPVKVIEWQSNCEVRWTPPTMPFKYGEAPVLIANDGSSDFPLVKAFIRDTNRPTSVSRFASRFRSRTRPLQLDLAEEVTSIYADYRRMKSCSAIAKYYYEALPYSTRIDNYRLVTYRGLISELQDETRARFKC